MLFSTIDFVFLLACIYRLKVYNRLVSACTVKTAIEVYVFQLAKNGTVVGFLRFSLSFLFACAAINRVNVAFRMTIIEDTHLTLAAIPFKVEANNSFIYLPLQTYEKKIVSVPLQSIISWSM